MFKNTIEDFNCKINSIIYSEENHLKKATGGIDLCNKTVSKLKEIVEQNDFETVPAEIDFFKNIKPLPMSYLIYYTEVRSCELRKPKTGTSYQIEFFEKEMVEIKTYGNVFVASAFLYGMGLPEFKKKFLNHHDPSYQVIISVKAIKE